MNIILNETAWVEEKLTMCDLGKHPTETLGRMAKYYAAMGCSASETRNKLEDFVLKSSRDRSIVKWSEVIGRAVRGASKYKLINIEGISITESELATIDAIGDGQKRTKQLRTFAFCLLCAAKYWNAVSENNNGWVNCTDREIFTMANISTSVKHQSEMYGVLMNAGLIKASKRVDNLNVRVTFINDDSPVAYTVTDYRNLGYQYRRLCGESGFYECMNCGIITRENQNKSTVGRKPKYCTECANIIHIKQSVDSVMRAKDRKRTSCACNV